MFLLVLIIHWVLRLGCSSNSNWKDSQLPACGQLPQLANLSGRLPPLDFWPCVFDQLQCSHLRVGVCHLSDQLQYSHIHCGPLPLGFCKRAFAVRVISFSTAISSMESDCYRGTRHAPLLFDLFEDDEEDELQSLPVPPTCTSTLGDLGVDTWHTIQYVPEVRFETGRHCSTQTLVSAANAQEWMPCWVPLAEESCVDAADVAAGHEGLASHVISSNAAISTCEKGGQCKQGLVSYASSHDAQVAKGGLGLRAHVVSFNAAISSYASGGQWEQALSLLLKMRDTSISTTMTGPGDVISLSAAISPVETGGQYGHDAQHSSLSANVISSSAAISACGKEELPLAVHMTPAPTQPSQRSKKGRSKRKQDHVISHNEAIFACEKGVPAALREDPHVISHNAAISAYDKGLPHMLRGLAATSVHDACEKGGQSDKISSAELPRPPEVVSFNAAISVCERGDPGVISHSAAISPCEKGEQWEQDLPLLQKPGPDNVISHSAVIPESATGGQFGQDAQVISSNAAMSPCEKGGQWEQDLTLPLKPRPASVISNSAAISANDAREKGEQWEQAVTLSPMMPDTGMISHDAPNANCSNQLQCSHLSDACAKGGQCEQAASASAAPPASASCDDNVISHNAVISACEKEGQWEQAFTLLPKMRDMMISHSAAISANGATGGHRDSSGYNGPVNVTSHSAAISPCEKGEQWEQDLPLLQKPGPDNVISHSAVIPESATGGQFGQDAQVISSNAAISPCEKGGQWEQDLTLPRKPRPASVISNNAAISACETGAQYQDYSDADIQALFSALPERQKLYPACQPLVLFLVTGGLQHVNNGGRLQNFAQEHADFLGEVFKVPGSNG